MILEQHIWRPKIERTHEVATLGKALLQHLGVLYRVYTPLTGLWGLVVFEFQHEGWVEREAAIRRRRADPEFQAFWKRSNEELVENERRLELYRILGTPPTSQGTTGKSGGVLEHVTWLAQMDHRDEVLALVEAECKRVGVPFYAYAPIAGPANVLTFEFQFADLAEGERWWRAWGAQPEAQTHLSRVRQIAEPAHSLSLYQLL